jgi:hypothetical protein
MAMDIELKQGEEKTVTFTYADALDVSGATLSFVAKADIDDSDDKITKVDGDFDKTNAATGVVTFILDNTDTATAQTLNGEITAVFNSDNLDRTESISIWIKESVA